MEGVIRSEGKATNPSKMLTRLKMTLMNKLSLKNLTVNATVPILFSSYMADGT
jgi:hypothetical protein